MKEQRRIAASEYQLIKLLPNVVTLVAICAGLTAIRFGFHGDFERAVLLILLACVLDGLDGRLARALGSSSPMGAELDSLADFLNFGVAPGLLLYSWTFINQPGLGWIAVLIYSMCCVIRLARFNVDSKSPSSTGPSEFFVGVPSPAGAMLVLWPMFLSFTFADKPILPLPLMSAYMVGIGFLMISQIPTYSFKTFTVSRKNAKYFLIGVIAAGAALLTYPWAVLTVLVAAYGIAVVVAFATKKRRKA